MALSSANFSATMLQAQRLGARLDAEAHASFMQVWRGCASDRQGMNGVSCWREPAGTPELSQPRTFTRETIFGNLAHL